MSLYDDLIAALTICLTPAIWSHAQTVKLRVNVPAPIIVDARGCKDRLRVLVDVYTCPILPEDGPWSKVTHRHFYGPDGSADAAKHSIIKIADPDFFIAAGSLEGAEQ